MWFVGRRWIYAIRLVNFLRISGTDKRQGKKNQSGNVCCLSMDRETQKTHFHFDPNSFAWKAIHSSHANFVKMKRTYNTHTQYRFIDCVRKMVCAREKKWSKRWLLVAWNEVNWKCDELIETTSDDYSTFPFFFVRMAVSQTCITSDEWMCLWLLHNIFPYSTCIYRSKYLSLANPMTLTADFA